MEFLRDLATMDFVHIVTVLLMVFFGWILYRKLNKIEIIVTELWQEKHKDQQD